MPLKFNKLTLTLVLTLTTAFSSNLEPVGAQNDPNVKDGYYYLPPHEFREWSQLTPEEQKKAKEVQYDRKKFSDWLLSLESQNSTKKQANTK